MYFASLVHRVSNHDMKPRMHDLTRFFLAMSHDTVSRLAVSTAPVISDTFVSGVVLNANAWHLGNTTNEVGLWARNQAKLWDMQVTRLPTPHHADVVVL